MACAITAGVTFATFAACGVVATKFGGAPALMLFLVPIILSGYVGGLGPGLTATAIAALTSGYFILLPDYSFKIADGMDRLRWINLLLTGGLISGFCEALHRSRRRAERGRDQFSITLASIGDGVITTDIGGQVTFLNFEAERLTGWKNADAAGKPLAAVFQFTDRRTARQSGDLLKTILRHGEGLNLSEAATLAAKDGRRIRIDANGAPIRQPNGAIEGVVIVFRNCTQRAQEAEESRVSELLYRVIAHNIPDGAVLVLDRARCCLVADGRLLAKICMDETKTGSLGEMFDGQTCESLAPALEAAFEGRSDDCELNINDCVIFAECVPLRDENGKVRAAMVLVRDITERKRAKDALSLSEERHRALVETTFDWVWEVDTNNRYTYSSPKVADLLGYAPEEMLGRTPFEFMLWDESEHWAGVFGGIMSAQHPFAAMEITIRHKGGRHVVLELSGVPIHDPDGRFKGYRGSGRDVTERVQLEKQFRQSQKMEAIGTLAAGVAHDFNNILTVIEGHASLLLVPGLDRADIEDSANQIIESADRAAGLTRQLLIFGRKQVAQPVSLDLNEVVSNLTKMLRRIVGEHISLESHLTPDLPLIHGDPGMMEQVLMNLAVNARDAMASGGKLTISTGSGVVSGAEERKHPDAVPGPYVYLSVEDSGSGISPDHLPHIFEPFFTTKEVGKGSGLGLATVYGIVTQHDGWISIATKPDRGTTFRICFPAVQSARSQMESGPDKSSMPGGSEAILVAEDDPTVRNIVSGILKRCGYNVIEAVSGVEALDLWDKHRESVSLLLTDMVMPDGVTGRELAERLLAQKPGLKVIYSSGYSPEIAGGEMSLQEGVNFLQKPYNPQKLAQIVRRQLDHA
jgi:PAS domain S-box-containing protein